MWSFVIANTFLLKWIVRTMMLSGHKDQKSTLNVFHFRTNMPSNCACMQYRIWVCCYVRFLLLCSISSRLLELLGVFSCIYLALLSPLCKGRLMPLPNHAKTWRKGASQGILSYDISLHTITNLLNAHHVQCEYEGRAFTKLVYDWYPPGKLHRLK